ncbi:MAG: hypothetical protein PHO46_03605 [Thermoguttaceae bacterium]|nr:hypothetical protein [Thermoguttaceae bacterium]
MKRNRKQKIYYGLAWATIIAYLSLVIGCALFGPSIKGVGSVVWACLTGPIWLTASFFFYEFSKEWTEEQVKEYRNSRPFVPPEVVEKNKQDSLKNRKS